MQSPQGATILRIQCTGKIKTNGACENLVSHSDIRIKGDIEMCLTDAAVEEKVIEVPDWVDDLEDELDDMVHDVASQAGSGVNNCGPREQYEYLIENGCSHEEIAKALGRG